MIHEMQKYTTPDIQNELLQGSYCGKTCEQGQGKYILLNSG